MSLREVNVELHKLQLLTNCSPCLSVLHNSICHDTLAKRYVITFLKPNQDTHVDPLCTRPPADLLLKAH